MRWEPKRKWNCRKKGQQKSPFLSVPSQPSDIQEVPSIYEVPTRHHPCLPLYPLRARFYLTLDHFPFSLIAWSPYAQYPELSSGKVEECSPILENREKTPQEGTRVFMLLWGCRSCLHIWVHDGSDAVWPNGCKQVGECAPGSGRATE